MKMESTVESTVAHKKAYDTEHILDYLGTPSGVIQKYTPIPGKPLAGKIVIIGIGAK